jgi:hypothetical protein
MIRCCCNEDQSAILLGEACIFRVFSYMTHRCNGRATRKGLSCHSNATTHWPPRKKLEPDTLTQAWDAIIQATWDEAGAPQTASIIKGMEFPGYLAAKSRVELNFQILATGPLTLQPLAISRRLAFGSPEARSMRA